MCKKLIITQLLEMASKGAVILAEYQRVTEAAIRSTEGKGMECTKYAHTFGIECYANLSDFITLLESEGVIQEGSYVDEYHFHYVTKLFAKIAGITVNAGEVSRIALVCKYLHQNNIATEDLGAWFEQVGGLRRAYQLTVAERGVRVANDNFKFDETIELQVWSSRGFLGILNVDANKANKLFNQNGLKPEAANNNVSNDNLINNSHERKADHA